MEAKSLLLICNSESGRQMYHLTPFRAYKVFSKRLLGHSPPFTKYVHVPHPRRHTWLEADVV